MIVAENITKSFNGTPAVRSISFRVNEGETLVLLGTSGCGKTTTLRMLNRLIEPDSGNITINGKNVQAQPRETLRRSMGYVLQNHGLFPHYTIAENITLVPEMLHWSRDKRTARLNELMQKLELPPETANAYPAALSGGQQQRVGLARALAADPPILLMDEPFGALDPVTRLSVRKQFLQLDELNKKTIVLVTHDVQEAFELGNRICLMDKGSVMQIGKPSELLFRPANPFVKQFFRQHQLLLELKSVALKDIWKQLPVSPNLTQLMTAPSANLWDMMDLIGERGGPLYIKSHFSEETREINFAIIETALSTIKKGALHE